jgi:hypothetical protein
MIQRFGISVGMTWWLRKNIGLTGEAQFRIEGVKDHKGDHDETYYC